MIVILACIRVSFGHMTWPGPVPKLGACPCNDRSSKLGVISVAIVTSCAQSDKDLSPSLKTNYERNENICVFVCTMRIISSFFR